MSFIYEHRNHYQYYRPKNKFKNQNFNKNLKLKSTNQEKWLDSFLNATYSALSGFFENEEGNTNSTFDQYYFNETNLDKDFDKKSKQYVPPFILRFFQFILEIIYSLFKKAVKTIAKTVKIISVYIYRKTSQAVVVITKKLMETG
jgi:hypothetical protein